MSSLKTFSTILRNVLSDKSDYCCLCFNFISETETCYSIYDEISLRTDIKTTEVMKEIISTVLGVTELESITANNVICQMCVEIIIRSYKFINQCRNNIEQLHCAAKSLLENTQHINELNCDFKSVFVAIDTSNCNIELYYDKQRSCYDQTLLKKRFQRLQKDSLNLKKTKSKKNKKKYSMVLDDVVVNKDDLTDLKCKICFKLYPTIVKIKQHYLRVHAPKDFKCFKCPKSFGSLYLRNRHTKDSHCNVVCSVCGKNFFNINSLRHHEQSHVSQLICKTCGKMYKGRKSYNYHIENNMCDKLRKSNAESILECDYCGKKYASKTALAGHIRLAHENGKALVCDWCGKKFCSMSKLKAHTLIHTKEKNFECDECGGMFVSKTSLLYHTRRHTGEKPYKCEYCGMSFLSSSRRTEHVKRQHTETNSECDICHDKFKGSKSLNEHRKKHFDIRSKLYQNTSHTK